jgi:hypothetical protein
MVVIEHTALQEYKPPAIVRVIGCAENFGIRRSGFPVRRESRESLRIDGAGFYVKPVHRVLVRFAYKLKMRGF